MKPKPRLLIGILSLGLVLGTGMAVAVGNPTVVPKVAAALSGKAVTDFTVVVGPGFLNRMFDFSSTGIFRANGTVIVNGLTTITVTRPDSSVISFRQRTDTDGRMRGFVYASVINQVGTYQIQIDPDEGGVASASFQITNPADAANLTTGTLNTDRLSPDFLAQIGGNNSTTKHSGKSIIDTEESTTSTDWTTLATPDEVTVTLPEDGLLEINYRGLYKVDASEDAEMTILLNDERLRVLEGNNQDRWVQGNFSKDGTFFAPFVLISDGELVRASSDTQNTEDHPTGTVLGVGGESGGSPVRAFAPAGTYTVSVQYRLDPNADPGGTLTLKNRKLWVEAKGY